MSAKKCKGNKILKSPYWRKAHLRKAYTRSDGTKVSSSYVNRTYVPSTCVDDRGKKGKGPKILPLPKKQKLLRNFGYKLSDSFEKRKKALKKASNKYNPLEILRHIVLIHNLQAKDKKNKMNINKLKKDKAFMKKLYAKYKVETGRGPKSKSKRKSKGKRKSKRKPKGKKRKIKSKSKSKSKGKKRKSKSL